MMKYDALIIGGGVSGMQCAMVLGSAHDKPYAKGKKITLFAHQRASHLQNALFNNVLGLEKGTLGRDVLTSGLEHLSDKYPQVEIIQKEKVLELRPEAGGYTIVTNKNTYFSKIVVLALNYAKPFSIKGLENYIIPHQKANPKKDRIQLKNQDHFITDNLYCCGTIAGHRSQFSIAAGSGAAVATDILTLWNNGIHSKVHDKV